MSESMSMAPPDRSMSIPLPEGRQGHGAVRERA